MYRVSFYGESPKLAKIEQFGFCEPQLDFCERNDRSVVSSAERQGDFENMTNPIRFFGTHFF